MAVLSCIGQTQLLASPAALVSGIGQTHLSASPAAPAMAAGNEQVSLPDQPSTPALGTLTLADGTHEAAGELTTLQGTGDVPAQQAVAHPM